MFYVLWWTDYEDAEVHHFACESDYVAWAHATIGPDKEDWPKLLPVVPEEPSRSTGCYVAVAFWPKQAYREAPRHPNKAEPRRSIWSSDGAIPEKSWWTNGWFVYATGTGPTKQAAAAAANEALRAKAPLVHYRRDGSSNTTAGVLAVFTATHILK